MTTASPLVPSSTVMLEHLQYLFGGHLDGHHEGLIELAWNEPSDRAVRHAQLYKTDQLELLVEHAVNRNSREGCNVYVGAALRKPGTAPFARAKDEDFLCLTCAYTDLDEPGAALNAKNVYGSTKPNIVVVTGREPAPRAQLWWRLVEPIVDPLLSQSLLKGMAAAMDGDSTVTNPCRVMRLAGSVAWPVKPGRVTELTEMFAIQKHKTDWGHLARTFPSDPLTVGGIDRKPAPAWEEAENGPGIKRQPDAFGMDTGQVVDGREAYMLATLNACLIQLIGEKNGALPTAGELFELAWPQFSQGADISKPRANGQPWTQKAFGQKAVYTLKRFAAGEIAGCGSIPEALEAYRVKQLSGPVIPGINGPTFGHAQPRPATPIAVHGAFPIDAATIPPRKWSVPGLLLCGSVSILVAPPGSGKSLLTLQMAIAVAAGVSWGGWVPRGRQKVLVINSEDDLDEMKRRLVVAAREMGIDQAQLDGWLDVAENPESIIIAKTDSRTKTVVKTPLSADLVMTIKTNGYGLVVVDPFAETFQGDENSNSEVKWAGVAWREVARLCGIALWLVHHTKKYAAGMAGDPDASRGGGAMVGIARVVGTLFTMTEDEAEFNDIEEERRFDYVRYDDGKANYSRKDGNSKWFEKISREVGNATGFLPSDEVGVLLSWKPPGGMEGITVNDLNAALDVIDKGMLDSQGQPTGQLFSPTAAGSSNARWCGNVLVNELDINEKTAKKLVAKWLKNKVLEVVEYTDPKQRRPRKCVRSNLNNRPGSVS